MRKLSWLVHYFGVVAGLGSAAVLFLYPIWKCCALFDAGVLVATNIFWAIAFCCFLPAPAFFLIFFVCKFLAEKIQKAHWNKMKKAGL